MQGIAGEPKHILQALRGEGKQTQPSKRSVENDRLKEKILEIYTKSRQRYGCIKIKHALERESIYVSQNRVLRLMRELNIRSVVCRKYRKHSHSDDNTNRPNLLKRRFYAEKPNQI